MNVENKWDGYLINAQVEGTYERFVEEDIQKALNSIKTGKAAGPSGIISRFVEIMWRWKCMKTNESSKRIVGRRKDARQLETKWPDTHI